MLLRLLKFCPKKKKKKGLHQFPCSDFLSFVPKLRSSPEISSYLLILAPNVFQQFRGTLLHNLHYSQKTANCRWAAPKRRLDIPAVKHSKAQKNSFVF